MSKDNGGAAFPSHGTMGEVVQEGMTMLDYLAAKAMQGMNANPYYDSYDFDRISQMAYAQARSMLAERDK